VQMLSQSVHIDGGPGGTLLLGIAAVMNAASVEIINHGHIVASQSRSKNPVSITIVEPRAGEHVGDQGKVLVQWTTTGGDGRPLLANVDYSADGGQTWQTVFAGYNVNSATLPNGRVSLSSQGRIRVRINDRFSDTVAISDPFIAPGAAPLVLIDKPTRHTVVRTDELILLAGSAFDDESHRLTGTQLRWFAISSTSGSNPLGTGERVSAMNLRPDINSIRLEATDHHGRKGSATIPITVRNAPPRFLELGLPPTVPSDATSVAFTIRASIPATLLVQALDQITKLSVDRTERTVKVAVVPSKTPVVLVLTLAANDLQTRTVVTIPR
jgi:hypothetical protein